MRTVFLLIITAAIFLASCSRTVKFDLLKDSSFSYPPLTKIKLFVHKERDLSSQYFEKVSFFECPSLREEIIKQLAAPQLRFRSDAHNDREKPYAGKVANFFEVVSDSSEADITIDLGVEELTYAPKGTIEEKVVQFALLGVVGLILGGNDGNSGMILVSCRARDAKTRRILYEFDVAGLSKSGKPRREALQQAVENGAQEFVGYFLMAYDY